jgi:hypothetical protein
VDADPAAVAQRAADLLGHPQRVDDVVLKPPPAIAGEQLLESQMGVVDAPLGILDEPDPDGIAVGVTSGESPRHPHRGQGRDDQGRDDHARHAQSLGRVEGRWSMSG